jgi:integrase
MSQLFQQAVDERILNHSPAHNLTLPKSAINGSRRAITPRERTLTLQVAEYHPAGAWVLIMLYCGLRPQETAALQGRHINLKTMQITIEQSLKADGTIGATKTGAGRRVIPIPPQLAAVLPKVTPFDFIFKSPQGRSLASEYGKKLMNDMWHSFKREMNIAAGCRIYRNQLIPPFPVANDLVPYYYRHTFATDAVTAGIDIETLQKLMGHASISVTAKFYTHMTETRLNQAAAKLTAYHDEMNRIKTISDICVQ